jgi:hypothetical protein
MTDLYSVRSIASSLSLSEETVDTGGVTDDLAALKRATLEVEPNDPDIAAWLSDEHYAGGVMATAATMNKRAELAGRGDPFNRLSRSSIIDRYNRWAGQFVDRLDAVQSGSATPAQYLPQLARFKADPVNNTP